MLGKIRGLWGIQVAEMEQVGGLEDQEGGYGAAGLEESSQKDGKTSQDPG